MTSEDNDPFIDPPNSSDIIASLLQLPTYKDVLDYINNIFPNLIVAFTDKYSNDYPFLTKNWNYICDRIGITPKNIIILKHTPLDQKHSCVAIFCELLTRFGNCVKSEDDLILCSNCNKAIPSAKRWNCVKNKTNLSRWNNKCTTC